MQAVWGTPQWRASALDWLDAQLAVVGAARTGEAEQPHLRPWATALKVPTTRGVVWLKATAPEMAFEVRLYGLLHAIVPDRVLEPVARDEQRGWLVLPDGGATIGERYVGDALVDALAEAFPRYGRLQRDLAGHVEELVAFGVADMRPAVLPARFDEALDRVELAPDVRDRLVAARPAYVDRCARLADAPGGSSLDHNDLHAWNVFVGDRFYDWGDCVVSHPFASLLAALGFMREILGGVPDDDPRIVRLRDAYLAAFSDLAPHAELVATAELACHVSKVARALNWLRAVSALAADSPAGARPVEYAAAPAHSLAAVLDPSPYAGA